MRRQEKRLFGSLAMSPVQKAKNIKYKKHIENINDICSYSYPIDFILTQMEFD